jgi:beta-phosphoglucomutase
LIDKIPQEIKGILFDLDGVLIDSMPHHVSAWKEVFAEYGVDLPSIQLRRSEGEKAKLTMMRLAEEYSLNWTEELVDKLIEKKRKIYRQSAPQGMRSIARKILDLCRNSGLKTAIVTGSVRNNLEWTLSEKERSLFDFILSSEFYAIGKPHPEPYLKATKYLHLSPEQCLVIENAPLGIRSAKAAGMTCIAIMTTLPEEELREADLIIPDLELLEPLIKQLQIAE